MTMPTPLDSAILYTPSLSPSLRSTQDEAARFRARSTPSRSRGSGYKYRWTHDTIGPSRFLTVPSPVEARRFNVARPAPAEPIEPLTNTWSPGRAAERVSTCRRLTDPDTVTSSI